MRAFISVELPDAVKNNIGNLINELKKSNSEIKWVKAENLHITLQFLGRVKDHKIDDLIKLTTKAVTGIGSFKVGFEGLGTFPEGKNPKVIWVGVAPKRGSGQAEGGDKLCALAKNLEETFYKTGYIGEKREFKSHITIGRIKDKRGADKLLERSTGFKGPKFGEAIIDHINIMNSTLTQSGPIYEKIKGVKI